MASRRLVVASALWGVACLLVLDIPAAAQELRVGVASHVTSLDVQEETSNAGAQFLYNIYDTLIEPEALSEIPKYGPGLALSWKRLGPTVTEFKLRPNVRMHDGGILEADDVAFSLNRVFRQQDPRFLGSHGRFFYNFDRVEVVDPLTVRIHTRKPEPLLEPLLAARNAGITSRKYVERLGLDKAALQPVGTGPYRVTAFTPNQLLAIERFDGHWGPKPPLDKITFRRIPEIAARITALVNKEVDFILSIPPDQEGPLRQRGDVKLVGVTWPMFHVYVVSMTHPATKDLRLRRALSLAIDRSLLVKSLWQGRGVAPTAHQFANYGPPYYQPDLRLIRYDPEAARRLIKESGYDGTPILLSYMATYYTYGDLAAQAVAAMWKAVGLNVKLQAVEGFNQTGAELMVRPWSNPMYYRDPMGAMDTHWSPRSWTVQRKWFTPEASPRWQALYETARFATNPQERAAAYRELMRVGEEELAGWILLYQPYESFAMRSDIQWQVPAGLRPYALAFRAGQIAIRP